MTTIEGKFTGFSGVQQIKPGIGRIGRSATYLKVMGYLGYHGPCAHTVILAMKHKDDIKDGDQEKFWVEGFEDDREDHFGEEELRWLIYQLTDLHNVMVERHVDEIHLTTEASE